MLASEETSNTTKRRWGKDEPFEAWVRRESQLDGRHYNISRTDLDVMWSRWNKWMLIEKKPPGGIIKGSQKIMFRTLDKVARNDPNYYGFHVLLIEQRFPLGKIFLDGKQITLEQLLQFLRWEAPSEWYQSYPLALSESP